MTKKNRLDRGLIAVRRQDGTIYLGWRMFGSDPRGAEFELLRRASTEQDYQTIARVQGTSYIDGSANTREYYQYRVRGTNDSQSTDSYYAIEKEQDVSYMRIPLAGDYTPNRVAVADLDGDGELEVIVKQPNDSTDPYQHAPYWKGSRGTYKLEAYKLDGTMMWRYDMGRAIEQGIWYSPFVAYDIDQDGKAEVYTKGGLGDPRERSGHVTSGPEYLLVLDGETGSMRRMRPWPDRQGFENYNFFSRNFLGVAYLDGRNPFLVIRRGTYGLIKILTLDGDLNTHWYWESSGEDQDYSGMGSHSLHAADVDQDGCDEIIYGTAALDHDGQPLWNLGRYHTDVMYVTNIDPDREGLEVFYGIEKWDKKGAVCLVDARTGTVIWENQEPTRHVHGRGLVGNIDPGQPGQECYAGEQDGSRYWLYDAKGNLLSDQELGGLSPTPLYWDDDELKEIIIGGTIMKYRGREYGPIRGQLLAVTDCLGDWREEIITALEGELRIYTTPLPSERSRPTLLHNRQYRVETAMRSMGYYSPPQLGPVDLE